MSLRIKEILTVTCLAAFIFFVNTRENYIDAGIDRIAARVREIGAVSDMAEFDGTEVRKDFGINVKDYAGFLYYGHESVMNSEAVLVVRLSEPGQADGIISAVESGRSRSMELFKSYSPEQYELLSDGIVEQKGNYVIYVVSDKAGEIEEAISDVLTGKE